MNLLRNQDTEPTCVPDSISVIPPATPRLLVIGHLDTVWPVGTLQRMPFRVTPEGAAHGPGIFDMKSGIVVAIEALNAIRALALQTKRPITLLLTCDEEIGSKTSRQLVEEEAKGAAAALVLEPPIPGGVVKTGRKGIGVFNIRAVGRAAHAGLDPRKGVNAIVELSHQVVRVGGDERSRARRDGQRRIDEWRFGAQRRSGGSDGKSRRAILDAGGWRTSGQRNSRVETAFGGCATGNYRGHQPPAHAAFGQEHCALRTRAQGWPPRSDST